MLHGESRSPNSGRRLPLVALLSITAIIFSMILFGLELRDYANNIDSLGADVKMGGVQVGGLNESQRLAQLEKVYIEQPVFLSYNDNPIWLIPSEVDFQLDMDAMQDAVAIESGRENNYWAGFWNYLLRKPQPAVEVDIIITYSEAELDQYLQDISNRYDASAQGASFDLASMRFFNGTGNTQLDKDTAQSMITAALLSNDPAERSIDLPTATFAGEVVDMDDLRDALIAYLNSQSMVYDGDTMAVSVYVQDLKTGEEMGIFPNAYHSAFSTVKLGIMINYFRHQITAPSAEDAYILASAVICSTNNHANELMRLTSPNFSYSEGASNTTQTICEAGAVNTAILSSLWNGSREELAANGFNPDLYYQNAPETPCPTSQVGIEVDTSVSIDYDTLNRTTAADMGTLLMQIYDCANYGSGLHTIFPNEITQIECQQMLELLNGTRFYHLAELGVPEDVSLFEMYHKVGYGVTLNAEGTSTRGGVGVVGDVGIIASPMTDYIFVVYISEKDLDNDGIANISRWYNVADMSRIVWNYFNPNQAMLQTRDPIEVGGNGARCVMPRELDEISLNDIDTNRFDSNNVPLSTACFDFPTCVVFDNWGRN